MKLEKSAFALGASSIYKARHLNWTHFLQRLQKFVSTTSNLIMRFFLHLVLVNLVTIPGIVCLRCSEKEQQNYLTKLHFEQSQIGELLARIQDSFTSPLNYNELAQHLLTLEVSDLRTMLREGRRFAETILDGDTRAAREFNLHATYTDKTRLVVHAGKTLLQLRKLEAMCDGTTTESLMSASKTDMVFEDVVSSFAKYKIHLRNLIRDF